MGEMVKAVWRSPQGGHLVVICGAGFLETFLPAMLQGNSARWTAIVLRVIQVASGAAAFVSTWKQIFG